MCGVFGIVDFTEKHSEKFIQEIFQLGMNQLEHRGPDETISFSPKKGVLIGMQRLSIVNFKQGLYPIVSNTKETFSVFNGEIYNHLELNLDNKYISETNKDLTDASSLSNGFETDGIKFLNKLSGMFAIAIWSSTQSELTLVRDSQGIKPLYYYLSNDLLIFASEPKAIYSLKQHKEFNLGYRFTLNNDAIHSLTKYMYMPHASESFANEIKQLPLGAVYHFRKGSISVESLTEREVENNFSQPDFYEVCENVEKELIASVGRHLNSDAQICIALSGGIDSALLANIAHTEWGNKLNAFCISFKNDKRSENINAKKIADRHCSSYSDVIIRTDDILLNFDNFMPLFHNLSTIDGGLISNSIMAKEMRDKGFKVAIYGEGADEIFGGYSWFQLNRGVYRFLSYKFNFRLYLYANSRSRKSIYEKNTKLVKGKTFTESLRQFELNRQLPQHLLKKIDNATMSQSIEGRVPYLDSIFLNKIYQQSEAFISSRPRFGILPDSNRTKPILRSLYRKRFQTKYSPPKKGFQLPLDSIVLKYLPEIKDLISSENNISSTLFHADELTNLIKINSNTISVEQTWLLWRILILEKWFQNFWLK